MEKGILEEDWLQVVIFVLYYSVGVRCKRSIVLLLMKYLFFTLSVLYWPPQSAKKVIL